MRKSFTRLFGVFILLCVMSLQVVAQVFDKTNLSPADGGCQVPRTGDFVITMNKPVKAGYFGTISLNNPQATEILPIQLRPEFESVPAGSGVFSSTATMPSGVVTWRVTFSGNKVTINFGYTLDEYTDYFITVSANAIKSSTNEPFAGFAQGTGTLQKCIDDGTYGWDFTTADLTAPYPIWTGGSPATKPTDEAINVAPADSGFILRFNEDVFWANTGSAGAGTGLNVGDIALYRSTDVGGIYGGDVVFPLCYSASITNNVLYITWPGKLPSSARLYVRIKPNIIEDARELKFAGFNTNGQPYGTNPRVGWNFTTKDGTAPTRTFAATSTCSGSVTANTNFTLTFNEQGIVIDTTRVPITTANVKDYLTFSGGDFSVTSINTSTPPNTVITIDPASNLSSGVTYSVGLKAGLWDSGDNPIPTKSENYTAGDFTPPTTNIFTWKNPNGTSFNLDIRVNNETLNTTYYYIVVKASDVDIVGTPNKYQPESVAKLRTAYLSGTTYLCDRSGTANDKNVPIAFVGEIVAPPNTETLELVTGLLNSDGTDYVVYLFGADGSVCGSNSLGAPVSATANITNTGGSENNGVLNIRPSTQDQLPPVVDFWAALVNSKDTISGCTRKTQWGGSGTPGDGITRNGPVYIHFNEDVENVNGLPITSDYIAASVTMNDGNPYNVKSTSFYDAPNKRMVIYPTTSFASGKNLVVTLKTNTIQDAQDSLRFGPNGTELLTAQSFTFCVEDYIGPIVTLYPCSESIDHGRSDSVMVSIDQVVKAPESDGGGLLSSNPTDPTFVGKYIQMRKHPAEPTSEGLRDDGTIIYGWGNPSYFLDQVTFTLSYAGDSTVIKVIPKPGFEWDSETWYSIELEQYLHTEDGLNLSDVDPGDYDDCTIDNYWGYFLSEDSRDPVCIFYEDEPTLFFNDGLGTGDPLLDGNLTVEQGSNILVTIDEWVALGFDGFMDLSPTAQVDDANALRRYFALWEVNGSTLTPISFDIKGFTLDAGLDIAQFYIDPYYTTGDNPNFVKGKNYRVCFIDNPNEFAEYIADPALVDDNFNGLGLACANFTCPADIPPPSCLTSATLNGVALIDSTGSQLPVTNIPVTPDSILTLQLCFGVAVDQPTGGSVAIMSGATTVQTSNMPLGVRSWDHRCITYTFYMNADSVLGPAWEDDSNYSLAFSGIGLITNGSTCSFPTRPHPFNPIHTIDGSAPLITSFVPDLIGPSPSEDPGCLGDKDSTDIIIVFDEVVVKQPGKKLEIWKVGTPSNTNVVNIDASYLATSPNDTLRIPNSLFASYLDYNSRYYINISEGFVKNLVGIGNAEITGVDSLRFCVGPDPVPTIVCNGFIPADGTYTPLLMPDLTIEFSEAVTPQSNKYIEVYEAGATTNYLSVSAQSLVQVIGSGGKKWKIVTANAFALEGAIHHEGFKRGQCYGVNIDSAAFKEAGSTQVTDRLITVIVSGYPASPCTWTFCIGDNVPPTVTFWPVKSTPIKEHIATNSYLYAFINEPPIIQGGIPLNVTNVENYFTLTRGAASTSIPFSIEFVGEDVPNADNDKRMIRVVPRDPLGPDWSLTTTSPAMMPDSTYKLRLINPGVPNGLLLQDTTGNNVVPDSTTFRVEDIVCPSFDGSTTQTALLPDTIRINSSLNEKGTVRWVVMKNGKTTTGAKVWADDFSSSDIILNGSVNTGNNSPFDFNFKFSINATQASGYDYDVYMFASDDEVDDYDADDEILAQWPYADPLMGFETVANLHRIKDLRPSPNRCGSASSKIDVRFCDNDKPILVKTYPLQSPRNLNFPVGDSLLLIFNERIMVRDNDSTGTQIVLRDAHNNLGVPLAYRYWGANQDTLILYPLDSTVVTTMAASLQLYTGSNPRLPLDEERDYYLEIDRWAISDTSTCANPNRNYFGEWVGKENLQFRTEDNTCPDLISWSPLGDCVAPEDDIVLKFDERNLMAISSTINPDSAYIYIYRVGDIDPHERIPVRFVTPVNGGTQHPTWWTYTFPTAHKYLSDTEYRVRVPNGLFIDNSGNSCDNGKDWTFHVQDWEDPIASWTLMQDFSYLNIALTDEEYDGLIVSGAAGETVNNVPTSSLLKIEFNEEVYIWDATSSLTDKWTRMDLMAGNNTRKAAVAATITLRDVTNSVNLVYDSDGYDNSTNIGNWEFQELGSDYVIIRVYQAGDHWMPSPIVQPNIKDLGFKSNTTYTVALAGAKFADELDLCDDIRNVFDGVNPLVTINTRDDNPPTLTITDKNNNPVCDAQCVDAGSPIRLKFSSKVVKTPWATIDYDDDLIIDMDLVNWWSNSNLPLLPSDLMATSIANGNYLYFMHGSDSVRLDSAVVNPNGMDILLYPSYPLMSQEYYVIGFKGGSVKDQKRIPDGNEFIGKECTFRVMDTEAPEAVEFFPGDGWLDISTELGSYSFGTSSFGTSSFGPDSMAIQFSEPIVKSTIADKLIIRRTNGQIFDEVSISQCVIDNQDPSVLVIPVKPLEEFKGFYVEVPAGFVLDTTSCARNGNIKVDPEIPYTPSNRFQWNFSTADATPPIPLVYIPNHTDTVPRNSNLTIIFDENIYVDPACVNSGIYIYHHDNVVGWVGNPGVDFGNIVEYIPFYSSGIPSIANFAIDGTSIYNGKDRDKIIFNPQNDFTRIGTYYIRVSGNCIKDGQGNYWGGLGDSTTWKFTVTNDLAPVLASTVPAYNHISNPWSYVRLTADPHGYVKTNLSMNFVDELYGQPLLVKKGLGKIKIMEYRYNPLTFSLEEKLWKEYDVSDPAVVFNYDMVTINDVYLRDNVNRPFGAYEECYYVYVDRGAVTNGYPGSLTFWEGIDNAFVWRFQTGNDDTFVAGADIISPNIAEHGTNAQNLTIGAADSLIVEFNENIEEKVGALGKVQVFKVGVTLPIEEKAVVQSMISGKRLTVGLANLVDETNYYVQIQADAFGDTSTISTSNFAFGGPGVWEFQTGDNTPPAPTAWTPTTGCQLAQVTLSMTFNNESYGVIKGTGNMLVTKAGGTVVATIPAESITISPNGKVVTAVINGLPDTTLLTVTVPAGFLFDADPHSPLPNSVPFTWTFTTGENLAPVVVGITPVEAVTPDTELAITFSEVVNPVAGKMVTVRGVPYNVNLFTTTDNRTYRLAMTGLISEATYPILIEAGAFVDVNAGCTPNPMLAKTDSFKVGDIIAPLATGSPTTATDYVGLLLTINFTDAVTRAAGNVIVRKVSDNSVVETIAASAFTPAAGNMVYTYSPADIRYGQYYITVDAGAFVDSSAAPIGRPCPGISGTTAWTLSIIDPIFVNCITIDSQKPTRAQQNVPTTTTVEIAFCDERIKPGTGVVTIGDQSTNRLIGVNYFEYTITTAMISGSKLTIPVTGLSDNTTYSIIIPSGAITDEYGNAFLGITDANAWLFTTGDFTDPVVTVTAVTVLNDGSGDLITITSSEAGVVYLARNDVAANATALDAAIAQKKAVKATVTTSGVAVSAEGLEAGTYKAYGFDASGRMGTAVNEVIVNAVPIYTIKAIQGEVAVSPLAGQKVRTKGTVTKTISGTGFYMQDENAAWGGIFVSSTLAVGVGSALDVIGTVSEVGEITTIEATKITAIPFVIVFNPITVTAAIDEMYESVLVKVKGQVAAGGTVTADWTLGTYTINNALYGSYPTRTNYTYEVTGIGSANKVLATEILDWSTANGVEDLSNAIKVYPNPFDKFITLSVSNNIVITKAVITNIAGQLVKEVINPNNTIPTSELRSGVYFISLYSVDGIAKTERIIKR